MNTRDERLAELDEMLDGLVERVKLDQGTYQYVMCVDPKTITHDYMLASRMNENANVIALSYYSGFHGMMIIELYDISNDRVWDRLKEDIQYCSRDIQTIKEFRAATINRLTEKYNDYNNTSAGIITKITVVNGNINQIRLTGTNNPAYDRKYDLLNQDDVLLLEENLVTFYELRQTMLVEQSNLQAELQAKSHPNFASKRLLINNPATVAAIVKRLENKPHGRYPKSSDVLKDLNLEYSIIKWGDNQYYAIDKGRRYGNLVGAGGFGVVKRIQNIHSHQDAVLKIQRMNPSDEDAKVRVQHELDMINYLNQSGSVNIQVIDRVNKNGIRQVEFVMPLEKGMELFDYLIEKKCVDPTSDATAVMEAYLVLKNAGVIHRDLKLENMHISHSKGRSHVAIIDYGMAFRLNRNNNETGGIDTALGTSGYMPPEFMDETSPTDNTKRLNQVEYSEKTDIYSLGVVLAHMYFPGKLYECRDRYKRRQDGSEDPLTYYPIPALPNDIIANKKIELVNSMMNFDPAKRPVTEQVISQLEEIKKLEEIDKIKELKRLQEAKKVQEAGEKYDAKIQERLNKFAKTKNVLVNLVTCINQMDSNYKQLEARHIADVGILIAKVKAIYKSKGSSADKLKKIMHELSSIYKEHKLASGDQKLFSRRAEGFHDSLNNNHDSHHYVRFVALAMKGVLESQLDDVVVVEQVEEIKAMSPDILKVTLPDHDSYKIFTDHLQGKAEVSANKKLPEKR